MKVAHIVVITPRKCGLYETTHETVVALRGAGIDSRLVEANPGKNPINWQGTEDRGVPVADLDWARQADVIVSHSGIGSELADAAPPVVYVAHGRPKVSYLTEKTGGLPLYSEFYRINRRPKYRAIVTYWPQHVGYLEGIFPDKRVYCVPSSVNLEQWRPGDRSYAFGGKRGQINVVVSDAWREDMDPFVALHAYLLWSRSHKGARLHIYGKPDKLPGAGVLVKQMQDEGTLGELLPWCNNLAEVYRAADFVLTPHTIDVRTVREAMACGCPVVRVGESLEVNVPNVSRQRVREEAEQRFDPVHTGQRFKDILEAL